LLPPKNNKFRIKGKPNTYLTVELNNVNYPRGSLFLCLFLLASLFVVPGIAASQNEGILHYDSGKPTSFYFFKNYGHAVYFSNAGNITIEGIQIYGCKWDTSNQDAFINIAIWDENLKTLYQDQIPYSDISLNELGSSQKCDPKWVEIPLPGYNVNDNFYVSVFTDSTPVNENNHGIEIGFSSPSTTESSHTTLTDPNRIDDTTLIIPPPLNDKFDLQNIDWMIRVHYETAGNVTSPVTVTSGKVSPAPFPLLLPGIGVILLFAVIGCLAYFFIKRQGKKSGGEKPAVAPVTIGRTLPTHHDVFISYARPDKPIADAVCAKLESANIRCWIAPRDVPPGMEFPAAIIQGIEGSLIMVLVFSSHSNVSPHVLREITSAVNKGIIIVPFRIEEIQPSQSMEYLISVPHWLDAITPPLDQYLVLLTARIEKILSENPRQQNKGKQGPDS
jgi:hypothetical protein